MFINAAHGRVMEFDFLHSRTLGLFLFLSCASSLNSKPVQEMLVR